MAVIKNKRIMKCLLMIVVSLLLVLGVSIGVSASTNYDRQEADACITISQRVSVKGGSGTTRVGRWMSKEEYAKMVETGKVQMSPNGNTSYVANPADINAFGSQAKPGSIYVEFDVDSSRLYQAGNDGWGQIPGPGSLYDRLNIKKGLPPIEDMPNAYNIKIGGEK